MFSRIVQKCGLFLCIFLIAAAARSNPVRAQQSSPFLLEFIYIDAAAGEAAAGHSAIKLGQSVFHYQFHPDGLLLLARQDWESFRYFYNDLSNRTLVVDAVPVSAAVYEKIRQAFLKTYIKQEIDLEQRVRLIASEQFFQDCLTKNGRVAIDGLGFFAPETRTGGDAAEELLQQVERELGPGALVTLLQATERALLEGENDSGKSSAIEEQVAAVKERIALREALYILQQRKGVELKSLVGQPKLAAGKGRALTRQLLLYQERTAQSILHLLKSDRADRGTALLVAIARYHAIAQSLATDTLYTLYPFRKLWSQRDGADAAPPLAHLSVLREEAEYFWLQTLQTFSVTASENLDFAYAMLEKYQARLRFFQLLANDTIQYEDLFTIAGLPSLTGRAKVGVIRTKAFYAKQLAETQKTLHTQQEDLSNQYGYDLFSKNCSTELIAVINNSFVGEQGVVEALGGYFPPGQGISHIPFGLQDTIVSTFNIHSQQIYPAYRLRRLQRLYEKEGGQIWFREGNTLTSTIYLPWEKDGYFLFFTDDQLLFRPFLGLANICYGTLQTVAGVFTAPVDNGLRFSRGVDGFIFSVPEIFFFNIRKGSFQVIAR